MHFVAENRDFFCLTLQLEKIDPISSNVCVKVESIISQLLKSIDFKDTANNQLKYNFYRHPKSILIIFLFR